MCASQQKKGDFDGQRKTVQNGGGTVLYPTIEKGIFRIKEKTKFLTGISNEKAFSGQPYANIIRGQSGYRQTISRGISFFTNMSKKIKRRMASSCSLFRTSDDDIVSIGRDTCIRMLLYLHVIRQFEDRILDLKESGCINGPVHTSHGHEAIAAAAAVALRSTDLVCASHRPHGVFLAKAIASYASENFNHLTDSFSPPMQEAVERTLAEILGLADGWCGGRGGSMHLCDPASGNLGSNGIVGGNIPFAAGAAWGEKLKGKDTVVVSFFGDGAFEQGCLHEAANMSALWRIPIIFFIENNHYAVATPVGAHSFIPDLALRGCAFGFDSLIVDGMDPVNVFCAIREGVERMRQQPFPLCIEAKTYRLYHHCGRAQGSAFGYRTKKEEAQWMARDPVSAFPVRLARLGLISDQENKQLKQAAAESVEKATQKYAAKNNHRYHIIDTAWPDCDSVTRFVRSEATFSADIRFIERCDVEKVREMTMVEAIASATLACMKRDSRVFVIGEEVANLDGGCFGATRGIREVFPQRLINTPISEAGFTGMAAGAAAVGLKPIVEIMFPDFALVAADQLFNQIGKLCYMYGGRLRMPLIVRTRSANGQGHGGQHSMDPCGLFALFSGWRIIAPSTPFDYIGLFNTAMLFDDPVLIVEYGIMYGKKGPVPAGSLDYYVAYGKGVIVRQGRDVTVVTYLSGVDDCVTAAALAENDGVSAEIIDLRTLDYTGMDFTLIGQSLEKTGALLIVEQAPRSMSLGPRICDEIQQRFFDFLDAPIRKVYALDVPNPVSRKLEKACLPSVDEIRKAMIALAQRR